MKQFRKGRSLEKKRVSPEAGVNRGGLPAVRKSVTEAAPVLYHEQSVFSIVVF